MEQTLDGVVYRALAKLLSSYLTPCAAFSLRMLVRCDPDVRKRPPLEVSRAVRSLLEAGFRDLRGRVWRLSSVERRSRGALYVAVVER